MSVSQPAFRAALLDPAMPAPNGLSDGRGAPAQNRFDVYRNNVTVALVDALRTAFPILRRLVGDNTFDQLALIHARAHPPRSPLMMHYGQDMPAFLEGFEPLAHIGYLRDVARLELGLRRAYHAADAAPMDPQVLAACPPETLTASTLHLCPPVMCIPSAWPLFDIWRFNTEPGAPKPQAVAQSVLITRPAFDPLPHALTLAQGAWMAAIAQGGTVGAAQDAATTQDPDFDLTPLLTLLLRQGAIAGLTTPKD